MRSSALIACLVFGFSVGGAWAGNVFEPRDASVAPAASPEDIPAGNAREAKEVFSESVITTEALLQDKSMSQLREYLPYARAIMIFPSVLSGGFLLGLKGGTGLLVARRGKGWSDPGFVRLRGVSFGFQIGGEKTEAMFLIMTEKGLDAVSSDNIKLGADVGVAALSKGISASAATTASATDIYSFGSSSGLFAGISIEGARLEQAAELNQAFYGEPLENRVLTGRIGGVLSKSLADVLQGY